MSPSDTLRAALREMLSANEQQGLLIRRMLNLVPALEPPEEKAVRVRGISPEGEFIRLQDRPPLHAPGKGSRFGDVMVGGVRMREKTARCWSEERIAFLRENYASPMNFVELLIALNDLPGELRLDVKQVMNMASRMGIVRVSHRTSRYRPAPPRSERPAPVLTESGVFRQPAPPLRQPAPAPRQPDPPFDPVTGPIVVGYEKVPGRKRRCPGCNGIFDDRGPDYIYCSGCLGRPLAVGLRG